MIIMSSTTNNKLLLYSDDSDILVPSKDKSPVAPTRVYGSQSISHLNSKLTPNYFFYKINCAKAVKHTLAIHLYYRPQTCRS